MELPATFFIMNISHLSDEDFLGRLTQIIHSNIEDESLCVTRLAEETGMSATTLNQRLHSINGKHLNQFIREVRLNKAFELLSNGHYTASEVAYQVGFSSPTYFNKCFHEHFGYPPGKARSIVKAREHVAHEKISAEGGDRPISGRKYKIVSLSLALIAITVIAVFRLITHTAPLNADEETAPGRSRVQIAVLPFRNMTSDTTWNIWEEGIQSCLINALSNLSDLAVQSEQTINGILNNEGITNYASLQPEVVPTIAKKSGARLYIAGNINRAGETIRLNALMGDLENKNEVSSFHLDGKSLNILEMIDSLSILIKNSLLMSELRMVQPDEIHDYKDYTTKSPEAYRYFIYGNMAFYRNDFETAKEWYMQALASDSTFYNPMAKLAVAYYNEGNFEAGREWCIRYYAKKDRYNMREKIGANFLYALFFGTTYDRIKYLRQLLDLDDQNALTWFNIGDAYLEMMQYDKAIPEFERALSLFHQYGTKPYWLAFYAELGIAYHKTGQYKKEKKLYRQAERDFPNDPDLLDQQAWLELTLGNEKEAKIYLDKWLALRREQSWTEAHISSYLAYIYSMAERYDKVEEYYRKALALEPGNINRQNNFAYFLIDKNRNTDEGLAMAVKALASDPENYYSMHITGYALYKKGAYRQALEWMEKSWALRMKKSIYQHRSFLQLEEARKAAAKQKTING